MGAGAAQDAQEEADIRGNELADREAKAAVALHQQQAHGAVWQLEADLRDACAMLELAIALLPLWPRLGPRKGGGGEAIGGLGVLQRTKPNQPPKCSLATTHEWR